ncbi:membrane cofactor protein-like, partial [Sagmatias obliquidens]|uniref:membrane cofactor protein-like n=1 Tax=Sagmatias obliquidens TaxID=3371155 RepID=UPI000F444373
LFIPFLFLSTGNYYFALVFLVLCESSFPLTLEFLHFSVVKCAYPYVENGVIVSGHGTKFYYKATIVYSCIEGFKLNGSNTIVCGANSTWEPEIPTCIKESTTPSTQPPISNASVSTPPSSQPPISSDSAEARDKRKRGRALAWADCTQGPSVALLTKIPSLLIQL